MKKYLVASALFLGLINLGNASFPNIHNKPLRCPSAFYIKEVREAEKIYHLPSGTWVSIFDIRRYDTDQNWIFTLSNIYAETKDEAYKKTMKGLSSLHLVSGPTQNQEPSSTSTCLYQTNEGYIGMATSQAF